MQQNLLYNENSVLKRELDRIFREQPERIRQRAVDEVRAITPHAFVESYVKTHTPLVIRGGAKDWPASQLWDFDYFAKRYADLEVVANLYDVQAKRKLRFGELGQVLKQDRYDTPTYLQEWWFQEHCADLLADIRIPDIFADDCNKDLLGFHNNTLWIGQRGAFTPLHQDTVYANVWSAQMMGAKEWVLIDKNAKIETGANGEPDYERFFASGEETIRRTVLEPGDILFMPYKWWHRAQTLEHAISLNTFYITPEIVQRYLRDVLSVPLAAVLNAALLQTYDPMRYGICQRRSEILTKMLGLNPENILNIDTSGAAVDGIYGKNAA